MRAASALLALALLAGCASPSFVATVSVRHQLPASAPAAASGAAAVQAAMALPKAFAIEANSKHSQSLAYQQFEQQLGEQLAKQGYIWQKDPLKADWLVKFDYQIDDGKNQSYQQPIWGTIGYSVSYQRVISGGSVVLVPRYYPETGIVGSQTVNETVYTRELFVDIYDRKALKNGEFAKLYEGRARNRSQQDELESAVPWLLKSLFMPFPGPSGASREVKIPLASPKP
jgi:hypothetical protein